ncbi:2-desacetyl-2-hydroxyethyl bacteriochlorophyllide A dehydrogenase [Gracilibacillus ureilyticus]|uniref:2-desacetyl-2-hydroxyethyl bacteriochlorophyllide A dehydrogenase n=1 Tax=Gracilibacillus ureilyticus TaxID=531814 RepID=A0A1H9PTR0_9BACI|nr:alcohol dehydrogenase catalytic domain-containing protein [Gracilibacillus ureilyticus]SER51676.1 2-desacetyl-2-hydroxyethyl bacteriochlorophyllide A dehydrogenase [Gracilibacillus ureilyticus]
MKAIVFEAPELIECLDREKPVKEEGYVLIKSAFAGICGSDLYIYSGTHPRAKTGLILGHEFSGTIASENEKFKIGTQVTVNPLIKCGQCSTCIAGLSHVCENLRLIGIDSDGGMSEFVKVPIENVYPLPEDMPLKAGALIEPVAVTVHAIRQGQYTPGDSVVIFGAGTIGICLALTLRNFGATNITIVEPNEYRQSHASNLGFNTINPKKESVKDVIEAGTNGIGADFVFDCAGHPSVLKDIIDITKIKGKIIIVAAYKKPGEVNLLQSMFKELSIQFVRVYTDRDFQLALEIVSRNPEYQKVITHELLPELSKEGFGILTGKGNAIKVMYTFE